MIRAVLSEGQRVALDLADGRRILVTVAEVKHGKVRLAFDAPIAVPVMRSELLKYGRTYRKRPSD